MASTAGKPKNARVCVLSPRVIKPMIARCCAYEFEDVIREIDDVLMVQPRHLPQSPFHLRVLAAISRRLPIDIYESRVVEPTVMDGQHELFFFIAQSVADLDLLKHVKGWRATCKKAVCWIEEFWESSLTTPGEAEYTHKMLELLRPFDAVFFNCQGSVSPVSSIIQRPCHYIPPGIDALRFCPPSPWPQRSIDVYYMGRRSSVTHDALLEWAHRRHRFYLYDTGGIVNVQDPAQHRQLLASMIQRTRYFFANRSKVDNAPQTQGQEEFGFRFFEGMAAGAILIGESPNNPAFDECFDWPDAAIWVPFDAPSVGEIIDELDRQPERMALARKANILNVLRRHDWMHRWQTVLETVGLAAAPNAKTRDAKLEETAEAVDTELIDKIELGAS